MLQLVKPGFSCVSCYVTKSWVQSNENPNSTPMVWEDPFLTQSCPWVAGRFVDLWVVVCDQGMVRKIEAQNLYYFKEWNILLNTIYLEIGRKFHDAINKHTYTDTRTGILWIIAYWATSNSHLNWRTQPTSLMWCILQLSEVSHVDIVFDLFNLALHPIRPLGTCFIEFSIGK